MLRCYDVLMEHDVQVMPLDRSPNLEVPLTQGILRDIEVEEEQVFAPHAGKSRSLASH